MAFFSTRSGQFAYFSEQLGVREWGGKDVLDFGGNIGNILRDPLSTIEEERYWCIEVIKEAVEKGRLTYPKAHWLFYDRYNFAFNPYGVPGLSIPDPGRRFDFIVAYSVFTSTPKDEMLELVAQLRAFLKDDGLLAFSFIDPHFHSWPGRYDGCNLQWRLERERAEGAEIDIPELVGRLDGSRWCTLLNESDLYLEDERPRDYPRDSRGSCHVYYSADYMKSLFSQAHVLPPVNGEMQHCCMLRRPET
jgi:SAM-dependent methyltransferase